MNIIVTGGSGYLGSVLTSRLKARGHDVTVLDRVSPIDNVKFILSDIRTVNLSVFDKFDLIIHLAAIVGEAACDKKPLEAIQTNYLATNRLTSTGKKIIYTSSSSAYGNVGHYVSETSPSYPLSLYAGTKLEAESSILNSGGIVLRPATLHGMSPRMRYDLIVNLLVRNAITKGQIDVYGGPQKRSFLHVLDASEMICSMIYGKSDIYNIGSENMTIFELADKVKSLIPCNIRILPEAKDERSYWLVWDKAIRTFFFMPSRTVEYTINEIKRSLADNGF